MSPAPRYVSPYLKLRQAEAEVAWRIEVEDGRGEAEADRGDRTARPEILRALMAQQELLRALMDGALQAEGQLEIYADQWVSNDNPRFPRLLQADSSIPPEVIPRDWWLNVGLGVEIHWLASSLSRRVGGRSECMKHVRIKRADIDQIWPEPSEASKTASDRLHAGATEPPSDKSACTDKPIARKPGRRPKLDWSLVEDVLTIEIEERGFPDPDNDDPDWQTAAAVERFVHEFLSDRGEEAAESTVALHVRKMLPRIKAQAEKKARKPQK